jgi:hypothetical protein
VGPELIRQVKTPNPFFWLASLAKGFSLRILLFGKMVLDHPQKSSEEKLSRISEVII